MTDNVEEQTQVTSSSSSDSSSTDTTQQVIAILPPSAALFTTLVANVRQFEAQETYFTTVHTNFNVAARIREIVNAHRNRTRHPNKPTITVFLSEL